MSIEVKTLRKVYGEQVAVNDISFAAGTGELVGFLGPNGAGKSTTMKMITGYLVPDGGHALVCGQSVLEEPLATKSKIGYLPESNPLYYDMYVREYLRFTAGIYKLKAANNRVEEVINLVGLTPEANKTIGQLSKGYKQRVGLAAAIIHDPQVLILDEPTSGLDPNQIVEIRQLIKRLAKEKTVLLSTHIMQEVEALCTRVIIINKGNIVANDSLENLRNQTAEKVLLVAFTGQVELQQLAAIPGITEVVLHENGSYELWGNSAEEMWRIVTDFSAQKGIGIRSIQAGGTSLEDIFRQLTAG